MLRAPLLVGLSLGLPVLPTHHATPATAAVPIESVSTVPADLINACPRVLYRGHPFGPPGVTEYRSVSFGTPAPQSSKTCRVARAGKRGAAKRSPPSTVGPE